ncbi:MAG TPA: cyclic nucleotide-binding domain-containing protein, partial [Leptospiraceae bacterium]|nr:cyclic nucleotide-binding domain-containing protein [Leptospiraceae bacterium]
GFSDSKTLKLFPDLELALEFVEDEILKTELRGTTVAKNEMKLEDFEFFSGVDKKVISNLASHFKQKKLSSGEYIFKKGDMGDEIYFIRKGDVKIELPISLEQTLIITILARGDFLGEIAFLDANPRSANAVASGDVSVYYMSRKELDKVFKKYPKLGNVFFERLARAISTRLRLTDIELAASKQ